MTLTSLGFMHGEVTRAAPCQPADPGPDARLLVPGRVGRKKVEFLLDTGASDGLTLDAAYVERERFPVAQGGHRPFAASPVVAHGVALVSEVSSPLGRAKATPGRPLPVPFAATGSMTGLDLAVHRRPFVGLVGAAPLGACVLGVDTRRAEIAVSRRPDLVRHVERARLTRAARELRIINSSGSWSPVTDDPDAPALPGGGLGVWLLDTGARWSTVATEYVPPAHAMPAPVSADAREAAGHDTEVAWTLEWAGHRTTTLLPGLPMAPFAADVKVPRVDGILGMDLLGQWLLVFDLARYRVLLFDYS